MKFGIRQKIVLVFVLFLSTAFILLYLRPQVASAGSVTDFGQLSGVPASANYVAWLGTAGTPPSQVLTEDRFNSGSGQNGGYQGGFWILPVGEFTSPAAAAGDSVSIVFGGLGADAGNLWTYTIASWDNSTANTDHGTVATTSAGSCPVMSLGSQDGTGKTINWTGDNVQHLIYRSQNASGAGNGASNGRYDYVATISPGTFTYLDTACPTGTDCWHIVLPTDGAESINGCHSVETNPTAVSLADFSAAGGQSSQYLLILVVGVAATGALIAGAVLLFRKKVA